MTALSLAEMKSYSDVTGGYRASNNRPWVEVLQAKLKEAAFRAGLDGDTKLEAFTNEVLAELASKECDECKYLQNDLDDEKKLREKAEKEVEKLEAEIERANDSCSVLNDRVDDLLAEIANLKAKGAQ